MSFNSNTEKIGSRDILRMYDLDHHAIRLYSGCIGIFRVATKRHTSATQTNYKSHEALQKIPNGIKSNRHNVPNFIIIAIDNKRHSKKTYINLHSKYHDRKTIRMNKKNGESNNRVAY